MAANLTATQLLWLQQHTFNRVGQMLGAADVNPGADGEGNYWHIYYTGGWSGGEAGAESGGPIPTAYARDVIPGRSAVGDAQDMYALSGMYLGTATIKPDGTVAEFWIIAALVAIPFALTAIGVAGAAAGAAGGAGGSLGAGAGLSAGESLVPAVAAPAVSTGTAAAGGLGSIAGIAGTLGKVASAIGAILGLAQGQGAQPQGLQYGATPPQFTPITTPPQNDTLLWIGLAAAGAILLT